MPTPAEILINVAALQNDIPQDVYTAAACLPYFNMAMRSLQETFELNDISSTKEVSAVIAVNVGISKIGFSTTPPLPPNLIEIKQLWESSRGMNNWTSLRKVDFIPHYLENATLVSQFLIWAWINQEIRLISANSDNDLKLDYVKSLFDPILIADVDDELGIINCQSYLEFKTASLCSFFIGENESRAMIQNTEAEAALTRSLGISVKGQQQIIYRRRPFRSSFKSRTVG